MLATALVSGGKDSIYSAYLAETQGWSVEELVTIQPSDPDSMMFHTPNLPMVSLQAEAWGKSHRSVEVPGTGEAAERQALEAAVQKAAPWIVAGAVGSSFQWANLQRVAYEAGRRVYTPLWGKDPARVVAEEIAAGLDIRFVHLAAEALDASLLGQPLDEKALARLKSLAAQRERVHVAGEGGEYETLVVDAPFFGGRIILDQVEAHQGRDVSHLSVLRAHLEPKGSS